MRRVTRGQHREIVAGIEIGHPLKGLGGGDARFREAVFFDERMQSWSLVIRVA